MTETEMNELISEFMELKLKDGSHKYPTGLGICKYMWLKYHSDWNWLRLAWQKFRDLKFTGIHEQFEHGEFKQNIAHVICYGTIESSFQSIVSAIQWYNSINNKS